MRMLVNRGICNTYTFFLRIRQIFFVIIMPTLRVNRRKKRLSKLAVTTQRKQLKHFSYICYGHCCVPGHHLVDCPFINRTYLDNGRHVINTLYHFEYEPKAFVSYGHIDCIGREVKRLCRIIFFYYLTIVLYLHFPLFMRYLLLLLICTNVVLFIKYNLYNLVQVLVCDSFRETRRCLTFFNGCFKLKYKTSIHLLEISSQLTLRSIIEHAHPNNAYSMSF